MILTKMKETAEVRRLVGEGSCVTCSAFVLSHSCGNLKWRSLGCLPCVSCALKPGFVGKVGCLPALMFPNWPVRSFSCRPRPAGFPGQVCEARGGHRPRVLQRRAAPGHQGALRCAALRCAVLSVGSRSRQRCWRLWCRSGKAGCLFSIGCQLAAGGRRSSQRHGPAVQRLWLGTPAVSALTHPGCPS
jgi:hypothetical protein